MEAPEDIDGLEEVVFTRHHSSEDDIGGAEEQQSIQIP
jgi:hypothetical protein